MSETAPISYIHDGDHFLQSALLLPREQRRVLALRRQLLHMAGLQPVRQRQFGTLLQRLHALLDERDESILNSE